MRAPAAALLALTGLACSGPPPAAQLSVELLGGFVEPVRLPPGAARAELLLDLTASMTRPGRAGVAPERAARRELGRLLEQLPLDTEVGLHVLVPPPEGCRTTLRSARSVAGAARAPLLARADAVAAGGEASLAAGVARLRRSLERDGRLVHTRMVLFTDLGGECGGDLCDALAQVVAGGARVDLVVLGDAPVPACFERFEAIGSWRPSREQPRPAPEYRVETIPDAETGRTRVVARGRADGGAVAVPAGRVQIVVELDPELFTGPLPLEPGERGRLHVLDFPALDPPVREWRWARERGPGGA